MLSAPRRLRCNFTDLPLALSDATPYLSWWVSPMRPAEPQSAYEIVAASTLQGPKASRNDLWESGVVIRPGCSAQVIMPDGTEQLAQSGRHRFVMDFDSRPDDVPTLLNVAGIRADGG